MGKSSSAKMEVTEYRMSLHYGVCHGPIDALLGITVGEKLAWSGSATAETAISVSSPNLFGGVKKEGGVQGTAYFLPGDSTQVMPSNLATKLGRTSANCPAYRGLASIFFYGSAASGVNIWGFNFGVQGAGFMWGANNPYLRDIWMKVKRSPKALAAHLRMIGVDANPAAIIYECLIDTDWGMGAPASLIDLASFETAAATLFTENFGLSLAWFQQSTIESFVSEVLDHIIATLFVNPRTGLITLKLIRDDYVVGDLPVLDPDNCEVTSFDRKAWGETVNEIVVTWTNPENEQEETVTAQDLANITIQGGIVSASRNYYGIRNAGLAMRVAKRDLATSAAPLANFEIEVSREAWDFVPGGCVVLNYPEEGVAGLVLRVMKIDYGRPGQPTIKVTAIEDIFSLPTAAYVDPDESYWEDPSSEPEPMDHIRITTAPAFFTAAALNRADIESLIYPEVFAAILASQTTSDAATYDLVGQATLPNGTVVGEPLSTKPVLGFTQLDVAWAAEAITIVDEFPAIVGGAGPALGGFIFIGDTTEPYQEVAMVQASDETTWTIARGVLDTVPRAWPVGTPLFFAQRDTDFLDAGTIRSASETAVYKMLPRASLGILADADAATESAVLTARPHLPFRPANVTVGGVSFGSVDLGPTPPATIPVTWSNRNRTMEDSQVLNWTASDVPVETGQTTTVKVVALDGTLLTAHNDLVGGTFDLPAASFGAESIADVVVTAKRDGLESLQGLSIRVNLGEDATPPPGDPPPPDGGGGGVWVPPPPPGGGAIP